jgi:hypothetical protein
MTQLCVSGCLTSLTQHLIADPSNFSPIQNTVGYLKVFYHYQVHSMLVVLFKFIYASVSPYMFLMFVSSSLIISL